MSPERAYAPPSHDHAIGRRPGQKSKLQPARHTRAGAHSLRHDGAVVARFARCAARTLALASRVPNAN
eukprot:420187-Prymnesium_polylepis.1